MDEHEKWLRDVEEIVDSPAAVFMVVCYTAVIVGAGWGLTWLACAILGFIAARF